MTNSQQTLAALARRPEVTRLYIQGWTQQAIADHFGVHKAQINRDLKKIKKELLAQSVGEMKEGQALIEASLNQVKRLAYEGWERSVKDAERQKVSTGRGGGKGKKAPAARIEKTTEGQAGDPRFLAIIKDCDKQLAELKGWNEPRKTELSGSIGQRVEVKVVEVIRDPSHSGIAAGAAASQEPAAQPDA